MADKYVYSESFKQLLKEEWNESYRLINKYKSNQHKQNKPAKCIMIL